MQKKTIFSGIINLFICPDVKRSLDLINFLIDLYLSCILIKMHCSSHVSMYMSSRFGLYPWLVTIESDH